MTPEEIKHYEMVCRHDAPYPLNYLPYGNEGQYNVRPMPPI